MEREIKFRAWVKKGKAMADWKNILQECDRFTLLKNENFIFMQFIGRLDKNGKEIYEGDICKCHRFIEVLGENMGVCEGEEEIICIVEYVENNSQFGFMCQDEDFGYLEPISCSDDGIEIIGNIYENPEPFKLK